MSSPALTPFVRAWQQSQSIDGWLTQAQAEVLYAESLRVSPGPVVEIGSHLGRSTVVLAAAGSQVVAVDPFPSDWRYGRPDTEARHRAHMDQAGVASRVDLRVATSSAVRAEWAGPVRLLYIDGKHDVWSCLDDLRWTRFIATGDRFLVHDAFSSIGVTLALLWHTATTTRHRYLGRTGSLALFEVAPARWRDRVRVARELAWFSRNVLLKVLLRLRLRGVAGLLGHHDVADPY